MSDALYDPARERAEIMVRLALKVLRLQQAQQSGSGGASDAPDTNTVDQPAQVKADTIRAKRRRKPKKRGER